MPAATLSRMLRITPQQLRAFEATARLMSVTKAAQELCVSQPTISVQLKELATTLNERLIETRGRQLYLTQAGEELAAAIREIAGCWQRFEGRLAAINGLINGRLKLTAVTTAEYFVPDLLGPFAAAHPGVEIDLAVENRDQVIKRLSQGTAELAVMMMPPTELPLESFALQTNPLVILAKADHPLAARPLTLRDLQNERWLMREAGSGTRMAAEQFFYQQQFTPNVAMSLGSNEAIKHAVAAGLGIAVLSALAIDTPRWLQPVQLAPQAETQPQPWVKLEVAGFPIERQWLLVWRRDQPLSVAAKGFLHYLQQQLSQTMSS